MPKKSKIMKQNPSLSIQQLIMKELLKKMKVKAKPMKGGACCVDYISKEKKKKLQPEQRKELIKMLNKFIRESKKEQVGSGKIGDWFKKTFTPSPATKKFFKDFGHGFVRGFTGVSRIAEPILDAVTLFQPELAPLTAGVHLFNKVVK
jgi:hypothetical protein